MIMNGILILLDAFDVENLARTHNVLHVSSFCSLVIYRNTYTDVIMLRFFFVPFSLPSALTWKRAQTENGIQFNHNEKKYIKKQ